MDHPSCKTENQLFTCVPVAHLLLSLNNGLAVGSPCSPLLSLWWAVDTQDLLIRNFDVFCSARTVLATPQLESMNMTVPRPPVFLFCHQLLPKKKQAIEEQFHVAPPKQILQPADERLGWVNPMNCRDKYGDYPNIGQDGKPNSEPCHHFYRKYMWQISFSPNVFFSFSSPSESKIDWTGWTGLMFGWWDFCQNQLPDHELRIPVYPSFRQSQLDGWLVGSGFRG